MKGKDAMHRVVVVGSPRSDGKSAALGDEIFNACIEECPEDGVSIVSVSGVAIAGCSGCNACSKASGSYTNVQEGDPLEPCGNILQSDASLHCCVLQDDMAEVRKHIDAADELIVVSPVYFSGAPSQFKALLDRLQPYYFSNARTFEKRPLVLHVVGEGDDPHGFEALISEVRSAFAVAGFTMELVLDWVGKISDTGEITDEAEEYPLPPIGGCRALGWDGEPWAVLQTDVAPTESLTNTSDAASVIALEGTGIEVVEATAPRDKRPQLSMKSDSPKQGGTHKATKQKRSGGNKAKTSGHRKGSGRE